MSALDATILNLGFGTIAGHLNVGIDEVAWASTAYALALVIAMPLSGWLAANLGRKQAFIAAIAVFTAGSLACAFSNSLLVLTVARFIQGFGGGAMQPLGTAALLDAYPQEQLPKAFQIIGLGGMLGPLTGPLVGGWMLDNFPWQTLFVINVPIGLAVIAMASIGFVQRPVTPERRRFDWGALALMAGGLIALQYAIQEGPRSEWFASASVTLAALVACGALGTFAFTQLRSARPLVDLKPLRLFTFDAGLLLLIVTTIGTTGTAFVVPLFLQQAVGFDATAAGLAAVPAAIGTIVAIAAGGYLRRVSPIVIAVAGLLLLGFGTLWIALMGNTIGFGEIILPRFVQGLGNGLVYVPFNTLVMVGIPQRLYDAASGLSGVTRQLGTSLGYAVLSAQIVALQHSAAVTLSGRVHVGAGASSRSLGQIAQALTQRGFAPSDAAAQAPSVFSAIVQREAVVWGFQSSLFTIAMLFLIVVPIVVLLWRFAPRAAAEA